MAHQLPRPIPQAAAGRTLKRRTRISLGCELRNLLIELDFMPRKLEVFFKYKLFHVLHFIALFQKP